MISELGRYLTIGYPDIQIPVEITTFNSVYVFKNRDGLSYLPP